MNLRYLLMAGASVMLLCPSGLPAQGTAFTYQGRLDQGATPASGSYDFVFSLHDDGNAGSQLGDSLTNAALAVAGGLFTANLDFGEKFTGEPRWLEIAVRTNGGAAFTKLNPRQALTATPHAIVAGTLNGTLSASQLTGSIPATNIAAGSISAAMLANGAVGSNQLAANAVTTAALANGAVTAAKVATVTNWASLNLQNPVPKPADSFGEAMVTFGSDRLLVGAFYKQTSLVGVGPGAAFLYQTNGTLLATITNPSPLLDEYFGDAVAALGDSRILVGAPQNYIDGSDAGRVYLFRTNGALLQTITNPVPTTKYFGAAIEALDNDRIIISAPGFGDNSGAAYLFRTNGVLLTTFTNPTPEAGDAFGRAVRALGSNRIIVSAASDDTGATNAGSVYVFNTNGVLLTTITNPAAQEGDFFGGAIAVLGSDRILIGAYGDSGVTNGAGTSYLYSTNGSLLMTFNNPTPRSGEFFGFSIAAAGSDQVLIGSLFDDLGAINGGAAYLFGTNGVLIASFAHPTPTALDNFGISVAALSRDQIFIGASGDDYNGVSNAGSVYCFSPEVYSSGVIADAVNARSITTLSLEDGAVTAAKIGGVLYESQIPDLSAAKITSGTLDDARLSSNVALLDTAQTFSGAKSFSASVGIGATSPESELHIQRGSAGAVTASTSALLTLENNGAAFIHCLTPATNNAGILFGTPDGSLDASIRYNNSGLNRELTFRTLNSERMRIGTNGFVGIGTTAPANNLHVNGGITCVALTQTSDRNAKENLSPVSPLDVLSKVVALPISTWSFKGLADGRHMGPMAQDFYEAFGLGNSDKTITAVDPSGVALAAIQGLNQQHETAAARIQKLEEENAALKARLEKLERLLSPRTK